MDSGQGMATRYLQGIKHTIMFHTSCLHTISILVGLELDSASYFLFISDDGGWIFFPPSFKADGEMVILET